MTLTGLVTGNLPTDNFIMLTYLPRVSMSAVQQDAEQMLQLTTGPGGKGYRLNNVVPIGATLVAFYVSVAGGA